MKNYVINNGSFTKAGNFSGYTALGQRVHIYQRQMEALGWSANDDVQFPFYCIGDIREIQPVDEKGNPTPVHSIASGLDYPGVGPIHSFLKDNNRVTYTTINDEEAIRAFMVLALIFASPHQWTRDRRMHGPNIYLNTTQRRTHRLW